MGVFSNEEILDGIRRKDRAIMAYIYDYYFPSLKSLVLSNGGEESEARDIFQDSMMIIYDKIRKDELVLDCEFGTYLFGVWKNLMLKMFKKKRLHYQRKHNPDLITLEENWRKKSVDTFLEEHYLLLRKHVETLDSKCKKLLKLHFEDYSYNEIAEIMGFDNAVQVRKKKHRCKDKLLRWIRKDNNYNVLLKKYNG